MELLYLLISSSHLILPHGNDYYFWQWFCGLALCSIPVSIFVAKRLGIASGVLFFITLAHSVSISYNQFNEYIGENGRLREDLAVNSALSSLCVVIIVLGMLYLGDKRKKILRRVGVFTTINALMIIGWWLSGIKKYNTTYGFSGLLDEPGMNSCLMAMGSSFLIPDKIKSWKFPALISVVVAILLSRGAIGIGAFVLVVLSYGIMKNKKLLWALPVIALIAIIVTGLSNFTDSSGRFKAYQLFMGEFSRGHWLSIQFGLGPGSFVSMSTQIQRYYGFMTNFRWMWLHSDLLEIVWSHGVIGGALSVAIYAKAVINSYKRGDASLVSLLVALGGIALLNYPFRLFPTAALSTLAIVEAIDRKKADHLPGPKICEFAPAPGTEIVCPAVVEAIFPEE